MNATTADPQDEVLKNDEDALRGLAILRLKKRRDLKTDVAVYVLVNSVIWGDLVLDRPHLGGRELVAVADLADARLGHRPRA